ncbi:1329_t:CDS:2, partial [Acaulospora morrowiae]
MDNYRTLKELGDGSSGIVMQAQHRQTAKVKFPVKVAIKRMKKKFSSWKKVCELDEFKTLRFLPPHQNVISLLE